MACKNCDAVDAPHTVLSPRLRPMTLCDACYGISTLVRREDGQMLAWYTPQPHQQPYHESNAPNRLELGTRNTGKSTMMRKDAIIRCMAYAGFKVLILRRTIPDLRKSHLRFINAEMAQLGGGVTGPGNPVGYYRDSTHDVVFKNGSFMQFSHCETLKDVENYLSSEWDLIIFDELSTFTLEMFLKISAAARSPEDAPYIALVRAGSNPLGPGTKWMYEWFVDHNVNYAEYPDYHPDDFEWHFSSLDQNRYTNRKEYEKRLKNLPAHVRKAWLEGQRVVEGAYFTDFEATKELTINGETRVVDWHVIRKLPLWQTESGKLCEIRDLDWISIYRAVDWGYAPDPAVCLWMAVLPNRSCIVFKEVTWKRTLAKDVAAEIKRLSEGMHVVDTFCDPSMFKKTGETAYTIGDIFEQNGVPMSPAQNDRELYGYAIHDKLNTLIEEGDTPFSIHPELQVYGPACPELTRTLPIMEMDSNDQRKIANGQDHWVVALAYFCMGDARPDYEPLDTGEYPWLLPKRKFRAVVG